jgi:hypothetical protein
LPYTSRRHRALRAAAGCFLRLLVCIWRTSLACEYGFACMNLTA